MIFDSQISLKFCDSEHFEQSIVIIWSHFIFFKILTRGIFTKSLTKLTMSRLWLTRKVRIFFFLNKKRAKRWKYNVCCVFSFFNHVWYNVLHWFYIFFSKQVNWRRLSSVLLPTIMPFWFRSPLPRECRSRPEFDKKYWFNFRFVSYKHSKKRNENILHFLTKLLNSKICTRPHFWSFTCFV